MNNKKYLEHVIESEEEQIAISIQGIVVLSSIAILVSFLKDEIGLFPAFFILFIALFFLYDVIRAIKYRKECIKEYEKCE